MFSEASAKAGITYPKGFLAAGVKAGLKKSGNPDVALIYTEKEAAVAGTFTKNAVAAAPVGVSKKVVATHTAHAIIANSGCANACDAYHPTASSPDGLGPYLVMQHAIADAGLTPGDIDYINAHGTGTPNNDLTEGLAAMRLFGDRVPPIASIKAYTGHTTSAAGSIEAIISLLAIEHQFLPINLRFRTPIPEHNFRPLTDPRPTHPIRHILSNSFGFGGNDTTLILSAV